MLVDLLPQKWHAATNRQKSDLTLQKRGLTLQKMTWPYKNESSADLLRILQKKHVGLGLTLTQDSNVKKVVRFLSS